MGNDDWEDTPFFKGPPRRRSPMDTGDGSGSGNGGKTVAVLVAVLVGTPVLALGGLVALAYALERFGA